MHDTDRTTAIWPLSLEQIDAKVSAYLGPGRVTGNKEEACFSRQISMYLAKHVGGWSMPRIGMFYNGRHHTTVLHAIRKVEQLRRSDDSIDALIEMLTVALNPEMDGQRPETSKQKWRAAMVDAVAVRVLEMLAQLRDEVKTVSTNGNRMDDIPF
ncbi:MAG TPA: helix-turn-helix domain-containing protein [Bryobacteraceae bacterium]|nr:helix-turn-helix domain-containing protein [Bryobacteraceae bacterium]